MMGIFQISAINKYLANLDSGHNNSLKTKEIGKKTYELYGLTDEKIAIVEESD